VRALIVGAVALAGCGAVAIEVAAPAESDGAGATAPGFALTAQDGRTVALADVLAGGDALLIFYRGFW
jgi:hypothetical protein